MPSSRRVAAWVAGGVVSFGLGMAVAGTGTTFAGYSDYVDIPATAHAGVWGPSPAPQAKVPASINHVPTSAQGTADSTAPGTTAGGATPAPKKAPSPDATPPTTPSPTSTPTISPSPTQSPTQTPTPSQQPSQDPSSSPSP